MCCVTTRHLEVFEPRYTDLHRDPLRGSDHALCWAIFTTCARWAISAGLASIFSQSSKGRLLLKVKGCKERPHYSNAVVVCLLLFIHATSFAFCMIGYHVLVRCKGFLYLSQLLSKPFVYCRKCSLHTCLRASERDCAFFFFSFIISDITSY